MANDTVSFDVRDALGLADAEVIFMRNWAYWTGGARPFGWPVGLVGESGADSPIFVGRKDINWNGVTGIGGRLAFVVASFGNFKPPPGLILPPGAENLTALTSFDLRVAGRSPSDTLFPVEQVAGFGELTQLQRFRTDGTLFDGRLVDVFASLEDFDNLNRFDMTGSGVSGPLPELPDHVGNGGVPILLSLNRLSGDVPASFAGAHFDLSGNQFTGNPFGVTPHANAPDGLKYNTVVGLDDGTQTVPPTDL